MFAMKRSHQIVEAVHSTQLPSALHRHWRDALRRLLAAPLLTARLDGVELLNFFIDCAEGVNANVQDVGLARPRVSDIAAWMRDEGIISIVYGENMHVEVLNKSDQLPRFLGASVVIDS